MSEMEENMRKVLAVYPDAYEYEDCSIWNGPGEVRYGVNWTDAAFRLPSVLVKAEEHEDRSSWPPVQDPTFNAKGDEIIQAMWLESKYATSPNRHWKMDLGDWAADLLTMYAARGVNPLPPRSDSHHAPSPNDPKHIESAEKQETAVDWTTTTAEEPHWYICRKCGGPISGRLSGLVQQCPKGGTCEKEPIDWPETDAEALRQLRIVQGREQGVDWTNDEAVVRAAGISLPSSYWVSKTTWADMRNNDRRVQAFERLHNPAYKQDALDLTSNCEVCGYAFPSPTHRINCKQATPEPDFDELIAYNEWHSRTPIHSADPREVRIAAFHRRLGWKAALCAKGEGR